MGFCNALSTPLSMDLGWQSLPFMHASDIKSNRLFTTFSLIYPLIHTNNIINNNCVQGHLGYAGRSLCRDGRVHRGGPAQSLQ